MHSSDIKIKGIFVVVAAGIGERMKLGYPKQFLEYKGKPLFIYPVEVASASNDIDMIIVVTNNENVKRVENIINEYNIKKVYKVISGGQKRQDSVYNALKEMKKINNVDDNTIVFIQDGVRPFCKEKYIDGSFEILEKNKELDGVVVGVPVTDTIKIINQDKNIISTPKREDMIAANTPQAFRWSVLKEAFDISYREGFVGTDDASFLENIGKKVRIIIGDNDNIKITNPEDLKFLK